MENVKIDQTSHYNKYIHVVVNDTSKFEGSGTTVGIGVSSNGPGVGVGHTGMNGNIITKKEFEFFAGQKLEDISDTKFKQMFRELDLTSDGELSAEEIETYKRYSQQKTEHENNKNKASYGMIWSGIGTSIVGCLINLLGQSSKFARGTGALIGIGGLALMTAGFIKGLKNDIDANKYPDVAKLDGRYKHMSEAEIN